MSKKTGNVYVIATNKGGVGKTGATTQGAYYAAIELRKKVLLIDIEPQCNSTRMLGVNADFDQKHSSLLFDGQYEGEPLQGKHGVYVIPGDNFLNDLQKTQDVIVNFARNIQMLSQQYDAIFIDVPPSGEPLLTAAYVVATDVVGLLTCEQQSVDGLEKFVTTINSFRVEVNQNMQLRGFVINLYIPRRKKQAEILRQITSDPIIGKRMVCPPIQNFGWISDCIDAGEPVWQKLRGSGDSKASKQFLAYLTKIYGSKRK
ncbi:cellulose biosynthesis protein BcsQ [Rheinheimera pacifica]|uniref:ParA family protein n=1 Tax=Rheinheimera pacifica TaxID=173990 RepID=UPI00216A7580|nr:ParA family protein [Rheinheimera pacifica]MCS4309483.1 cellulose biosynthesis protein BcsQ [Rheinheimera pacifica]